MRSVKVGETSGSITSRKVSRSMVSEGLEEVKLWSRTSEGWKYVRDGEVRKW